MIDVLRKLSCIQQMFVSAYYDRVMHRIRDYSRQNPDTGDDYTEYDLCADCYAKFTHFMENT